MPPPQHARACTHTHTHTLHERYHLVWNLPASSFFSALCSSVSLAHLQKEPEPSTLTMGLLRTLVACREFSHPSSHLVDAYRPVASQPPVPSSGQPPWSSAKVSSPAPPSSWHPRLPIAHTHPILILHVFG